MWTLKRSLRLLHKPACRPIDCSSMQEHGCPSRSVIRSSKLNKPVAMLVRSHLAEARTQILRMRGREIADRRRDDGLSGYWFRSRMGLGLSRRKETVRVG